MKKDLILALNAMLRLILYSIIYLPIAILALIIIITAVWLLYSICYWIYIFFTDTPAFWLDWEIRGKR